MCNWQRINIDLVNILVPDKWQTATQSNDDKYNMAALHNSEPKQNDEPNDATTAGAVSVTDIPCLKFADLYPDSKVHGANMAPIWGRQDPGGPHVDPMTFAIWVGLDRTEVNIAI